MGGIEKTNLRNNQKPTPKGNGGKGLIIQINRIIMKYIFIPFIIFSCSQKPVIKDDLSKQLDTLVDKTHKTVELSRHVEHSMDQFSYALSILPKRDSFVMKKYEYEVLYYQTENEKYRLRANRMVDSIHKYVRIADSILKTIH